MPAVLVGSLSCSLEGQQVTNAKRQAEGTKRDNRIVRMADLDPEERAVISAFMRLKKSRKERDQRPAVEQATAAPDEMRTTPSRPEAA
jgi:sRNA-binding protein